MATIQSIKFISAAAAAALACTLASNAYADDGEAFKVKRSLKGNMMEVYNVVPGTADTITEMFSKGIVYGRLRVNSFNWDWKNDDTAQTKNKDNRALGLGGNLIYKTASLYGLSVGAGLYYTDEPFPGERMSEADIGYLKAGKDTTSRYNVNRLGTYGFATLAQAYVQYDISKTSFVAGRQIFESFLTKSNDTKMIPNTFEGYSFTTKELPQTRIRGAWFYQQKLRDHETFHDVLTYDDSNTSVKTHWDGNDDSAVHKGLSVNNFRAAGEDITHSLIVADIQNKSIKNLQLDLTYGGVPGVVSSLTGEINYAIPVGGWTVTPGARYMQQMDDGGGKVGGASLKGTLVDWTGGTAVFDDTKGYATPDSLDSSLWMARLVAESGPLKMMVAYSAVADEADIVAPWRGFPTGGYTRAMAQYNWYANTKTTAAQVNYNFDKAGLVPGLSAMVRYAMQDFDEEKQAAGVQADSNILHIDLIEKIKAIPGMEAKVRVGLVDAKDREAGYDKDSYNEYRFELNYLF
ncbi:OprD family outer membrane porin [Sulfurimonas sp. HSL-1656]|uniref:OprD family outer membrane porin n=1 Tax=Thiomicrolovo subterrani TaxID=3131934 RepID=UPI0031FA272E